MHSERPAWKWMVRLQKQTLKVVKLDKNGCGLRSIINRRVLDTQENGFKIILQDLRKVVKSHCFLFPKAAKNWTADVTCTYSRYLHVINTGLIHRKLYMLSTNHDFFPSFFHVIWLIAHDWFKGSLSIYPSNHLSMWAVFKIPVQFHYTDWFKGIPLLDHCNQQKKRVRTNPPTLIIHQQWFRSH